MKNRVGEENINNQGLKMIIIEYRNSNDIDVKFEDGYIKKTKYCHFKDGCVKNPNYNDSQAIDRTGETNINNQGLKMIIIKYKNRTHVDIQFEDGTIVYNRGYRDFKNGSINHPTMFSLASTNPKLAQRLADDERNNMSFEDFYNIPSYSNQYFYTTCPRCGMPIKNKHKINNMQNYNIYCEYCSDTSSISEKFMIEILKQLKINYQYQLTKKHFKWCNEFKYDFYIPSLNMIIETNGIQHYIETKTNNWKTLEEEQWNDLFKYKCAKYHIDKYIVIDCRHSTLEWLKENIIKELNKYIDLSNIDWELAWEESQNSNVIKCWELWNKGYRVMEIVKELDLDKATVRKYLKRGYECGKCDYTVETSRKQKGKNGVK